MPPSYEIVGRTLVAVLVGVPADPVQGFSMSGAYGENETVHLEPDPAIGRH